VQRASPSRAQDDLIDAADRRRSNPTLDARHPENAGQEPSSSLDNCGAAPFLVPEVARQWRASLQPFIWSPGRDKAVNQFRPARLRDEETAAGKPSFRVRPALRNGQIGWLSGCGLGPDQSVSY
jgi:hypothetical protein